MLIIAAVLGLSGLALVVLGPGVSWQTRMSVEGGDKLKPSPEYIVYGRVIGALLIVAAVCAGAFHFSDQWMDDAEQASEDAWGISVHNGVALEVNADPDVNRVKDMATVQAALAGQTQILQVEGSAVVGTDAVGALETDFAVGDLLVAVELGSCELGAVVIQESAQSVTVAVTARSEEIVLGAVFPCAGDGYGTSNADDRLIVRVPLETPLGDRELILSPAAQAPEAAPVQ